MDEEKETSVYFYTQRLKLPAFRISGFWHNYFVYTKVRVLMLSK